jgi:SAM-dependent methyltransferase
MAIPNEPDAEVDTRNYYRARAPEFEQWILRQGRYAHGPDADAAWHREMAELQQFVGSLTDARVFEVASGTGWWTRLLARRNRIVASDYAPEMLEEARRRDGENAPLGRCRADAYQLPVGDAACDACMFGFWLSHVPVSRSAEFIREAARIVRPGGWIVLVDSRQEEHSGASDQHVAGDRVQRQHRRLNDGREFTIWKIYWTPVELESLLGLVCTEVEVVQTDRFFIGARGRVSVIR